MILTLNKYYLYLGLIIQLTEYVLDYSTYNILKLI